MSNDSRVSEAALVRAVRSLDQGDAETVTDKLERVWDTLSQYRGGSFHAAQEMLLRWLLKNMTGNSAASESVRRCPRAWDIMGAVFGGIPLFSLAKSLADRRFVVVLQHTLKEVSKPQTASAQTNGAPDSDTEMVDASSATAETRKRKRSASAAPDLDAQRQAAGCLQTAEAIFESLRTLLARCELKLMDGPPSHRMGAEHVKSLFSSSAADTMETLVPLLTLCRLAADKTGMGYSKGLASWLSTFNALWDLHLQSAGDASDVAIHLSALGTSLLGKLTGVPSHQSLGIDEAVRQRWAQELRRFLARNLVLPSRASFFNSGSQEVIQVVVEMSGVSAPASYPILFDLVSKSPRAFGDKTTKKDYDGWEQAVFDAILLALKSMANEQSRTIVETMMKMAVERDTSLSAASLRSVCNEYALRPKKIDWNLLLSVARLNPDVFLLSEDGRKLLERVLLETQESESLAPEDFGSASRFIVALAEGYARARDLPSFVKTWLKCLAVTQPQASPEPIWLQQELVATVGSLIQGALSTSQLLEILDWLSSQTGPAESVARIHILGAISSGLTQEEFIDAANMKTFDGAFSTKSSRKDLPASISASRWTIAEKTLSRGTLEESGRVWSQVKSEVTKTLRKSPVRQGDTFAAFKCSVAAWISNHLHGAHEDEAASLTCSFIDRLGKEDEDSGNGGTMAITKRAYISWILSNSPRLVSLVMGRKKEFPTIVMSLISPGKDEDTITFEAVHEAACLVLENENNTNDYHLMNGLVDKMISLIDTSKTGRSLLATKTAIRFMLDVPEEAISRSQREECMKRLISPLSRKLDKPEKVGTEFWKPVLSLMIKLARRPNFYGGMTFSQLEAIGRAMSKSHRRSKEAVPMDDISQERTDFRLLKQLAQLTMRQMTSSNEEREKMYLKDAHAVLETPCQDSDVVPRLILLESFIYAVQESADVGDLKTNHLLRLAVPCVTSRKWRGKGLLPFLVALEAIDSLDRQTAMGSLSSSVPLLLEASEWLLENDIRFGLEVRMFLANHFPKSVESPLEIKLHAQDAVGELVHLTTPGADQTSVLEYVDTVIRNADEDTKLRYLEELLLREGQEPGPDALGQLLIIYRLVQHLTGPQTLAPVSEDGFDIARAHSLMCSRLRRTTSAAEFILATKILNLLLNQKSACMTQWNIELTLSTVSTICSSKGMAAPSSPKMYDSLCTLVETVIKRHRRRLDGHFHILVTVLQSLLRRLVSRPRDTEASQWEKHAKRFSRLITLICEPTIASVSSRSSQAPGGSLLDSEKDRAKRYAGAHMYLVLMQYVKLQLEHVVPHCVREVLETGMYSVMDITTPDGLKIMNDAMDPSGRIIFKELYKQYQKFGKWSGV
ncbi:Urb2/Npa2 family-domain-containing protein [Podospora didyma]|uniref:Urb2/Npa2 family-domain-containing protein n=1 Tax=Podospora didyma TaxID=330526 RepID=A0AAE0KF60_9PEZI|nr:Urb2/Npa2 family-domain-containing protein [Podospora didyma]